MFFKSIALCASALLISPVYSSKCDKFGSTPRSTSKLPISQSFIGSYALDKQVQSFCKGPSGTGDALPLLTAITDYFSKQPESMIAELQARADGVLAGGKTLSWNKVGEGFATYHTSTSTFQKQQDDGNFVANLFSGSTKENLSQKLDKFKSIVNKMVDPHKAKLQQAIASLKQVCNAKPKEGIMDTIAGSFSDTCGPFCDNGLWPADEAIFVLARLLPDVKKEFTYQVSKYDANGAPTKETLTLGNARDMISATAGFCGRKLIKCTTKKDCGGSVGVEYVGDCKPDAPGYHILSGTKKLCYG